MADDEDGEDGEIVGLLLPSSPCHSIFDDTPLSARKKRRAVAPSPINSVSSGELVEFVEMPENAKVDATGEVESGDWVLLLPGQRIVEECSPRVFGILGGFPSFRALPRPQKWSFTAQQTDYMQTLFRKYEPYVWTGIKRGVERGKAEQHMNFDRSDFVAPSRLRLGTMPEKVLTLFLLELKVEKNYGAFPFYDGDLFGINFNLLCNASFTVRFFWK